VAGQPRREGLGRGLAGDVGGRCASGRREEGEEETNGWDRDVREREREREREQACGLGRARVSCPREGKERGVEDGPPGKEAGPRGRRGKESRPG
jgi:hypothetical protein